MIIIGMQITIGVVLGLAAVIIIPQLIYIFCSLMWVGVKDLMQGGYVLKMIGSALLAMVGLIGFIWEGHINNPTWESVIVLGMFMAPMFYYLGKLEQLERKG